MAVVVLALAVLGAACGGSGGSDDASPLSASETTEAEDGGGKEDESAAGGAEVEEAKDACAALPRATIEQVVGADPGDGELQEAGASTLCSYYGDAEVTVEIDPGADLAGARTSVEAYGDKCEPAEGIGDEALFCTGGFAAKGFTGQVIWTENSHTYFVVYNFRDKQPSKDLMIELASKLAV